jgi:formate-dependent nitrite reductase membrane component NrfD
VNCYAWLTQRQRIALFAKLPRALTFFSKFNYDIDHWRRWLALAGLPLSVGVGIYTGVLLGAVQSRPFWNTNLVAQLFLFSALSTGCAGLILGLSGREESARELKLLYGLDICFMLLEFFIVLPYLIHGELSVQAVQDSLQLILGGPFTILFWVFFLGLGLFTPLVIEVRELVPVIVSNREFHYHRLLAASTALLILGGGFLLRYIFVFAGQISAMQ